jgi:hypothetical protein
VSVVMPKRKALPPLFDTIPTRAYAFRRRPLSFLASAA